MGRGPTPLTVVIAAYNATATLPACLTSLRPAVAAGVEVVVVDDGSTDGTAEVVRSWDSPLVTVLTQPNGGPSVARNAGLEAASGTFVTFLDSDDEVTPEWHEFLLGALDDERVDLATCGMKVLLEGGPTRERRPFPMGPVYDDMVALFLPGAYAVRRSLVRDVGGFDVRVRYGEHHELAMRLADRLTPERTRRSTDLLVVKHHDRSQARVSAYASARLDSMGYVLERHAARMARDPELSADYHSIAGFAAYTLGERRLATRHTLAALRLQPRKPKMWGRVLRLARMTLPGRA